MTLSSPTGGSTANDRSAALVRTLVITVFLEWFGSTAIIPMLPIYIKHLGGSDVLAGLVMSAFFATGVLTQYPAGKLADRIGRRPVLLAGLLTYSLSSFAFLLPINGVDAVVLRGLQGIGAGAATVASLSLVASAVSVERRGRAFAAIYGGQIAGMSIGPLIGSIVGVSHMHALFLGSGLATLAACIPASRIVEDRPERARDTAGSPVVLERIEWSRATVGALVASGGFGLFSGVYDLCWTLLLVARGASGWQIGVSWTLFAIPFVILARPSGWLADHTDRKILVLGGAAVAISFCTIYPLLHQVWLIIALGAIEAVGFAAAMPALQSLLTQGVRHDEFGRVQGLNATIQTAVIAVMAAAAGALFALAPWVPFITTSVLATISMVVTAVLWRSVPGKAAVAEITLDVADDSAQAATGSSVEVQ